MTVVVDPSFVLGLYAAGDPGHARAAELYARLDEELVTTPLAVAELERLITARWGKEHLVPLLADLDSGAVTVRWWSTAMAETVALARERPVLGLTGASLIALAPVARTSRIATLAPDTFSAERTRDGEPYVLLPDPPSKEPQTP